MRILPGLAVVGLLAVSGALAAQETVSAGSLAISGVEVTAPMAASPTAAVYMTIANAGPRDDRLVAAETPAARRVELHATELSDGVARMAALPEGVPVPAGAVATLAPRGIHVMLMGLAAPLSEGGTVPLTLVFEGAGRVEIEAPVHLGAGGHDGRPMPGMVGAHGG